MLIGYAAPLACVLALGVIALAPTRAAANFDALPESVQRHLFDLTRICSHFGGTPRNAMDAVALIDLDGDGSRDVILDEGRFPCEGLRAGAICAPVGCYTSVTLNYRGGWRAAFEVVGSYCIDDTTSPPRLVTIQRNFTADGGSTVLNVRYRFSRGMAFQEMRGRC